VDANGAFFNGTRRRGKTVIEETRGLSPRRLEKLRAEKPRLATQGCKLPNKDRLLMKVKGQAKPGGKKKNATWTIAKPSSQEAGT